MLRRISVFGLLLIMGGMAYGSGQIDIAYSPYTISQPGSYIVVKDLHTPQDMNCIAINASNVTIDLNGHTLYGAGTTSGNSGSGIISSGNSNIFILNGIIRDFVDGGIYLENGNNVQITRIKCFGNAYEGLYVVADNCKVWDNEVYGNGGNGIDIGSSSEVTGNSVSKNGNYGIEVGNNCRIYNNTATENVGNGIYTGKENVITNNCCSGNQDNGILGLGYNIITHNILSYNTAYGIYAGLGCNLMNNDINNNLSNGIYAGDGCNIKDNNIRNNGADGIYVTNRCQVIGNNISNDSTGIEVSSTGDANLIAQNNITGCSNYGILCNGTGINYLNSNVLRFNITPSDISGSNKVGTGDLANVSY